MAMVLGLYAWSRIAVVLGWNFIAMILNSNDNLLTYHTKKLLLLRYHTKSFLLLTQSSVFSPPRRSASRKQVQHSELKLHHHLLLKVIDYIEV
jgi:hypothetical protein